MTRGNPSSSPREYTKYFARRRKQSAIALTIFVVFGLIVLAVVALGPRDSADQTRTTTRQDFSTTITVEPTSTTPSTVLDPSTLTPEGQELLALVDSGRAARFHAKYDLSGNELPENLSSATLEVWRSGGTSIRQDSEIVEARGATRRIGIGTTSGTVSCQEGPEVPLQCQQVSTDPVDPSDDFVAQALQTLGSAQVTVRDETIDGRPVRCYVLQSDGKRAELCLTPAGVPVVIDTSGLRGELTVLDETFDDSVFTPPVPPVVVSTSISTN